MYFDKAYFDDSNNPVEVSVICNKCGKIISIHDMTKFCVIKNDYCIIKDNDSIICDECNNICTGMIQYKSNPSIKESIINKPQPSLNIPKCPTCGSTKLSNVSTLSKAGSVFMFGLLSQKVKKTWHCNNCGYEW